ncbi:MAG: sodium:calcium antiporter [Mariprofundaceae bacterium]
MIESIASLILALIVVFAAAEMFTNSLEHLGERLGVSEGVTGSIFAAVGTAMPETIIPIVAIIAGGASETINHEVGMGAILGAPFMLATLSVGLMGWFAGRKRGWNTILTPEATGMKRDLSVFLTGYLLVITAALLPEDWEQAKIGFSLSLFLVYFFYLLATIKASRQLVNDGHGTEADHGLYMARLFGDSTPVAVVQLVTGLAILVVGAKMFVHGVELASSAIGVSALVISLLIVPVATELPEKINSILWVRKGRDTLAIGNITGAMVFQGTVIPAAAMLLMPWHFQAGPAVVAILLALLGNGWLWYLSTTGRLTGRFLSMSMLLYAVFILYVALG